MKDSSLPLQSPSSREDKNMHKDERLFLCCGGGGVDELVELFCLLLNVVKKS